MLLELIVELIALIGEIAVEGLFEFGYDYAADWLAKRRK